MGLAQQSRMDAYAAAELRAEAWGKATSIASLTDAIGELNRTPGTLTDEQMARALQRILAKRGLSIVPTNPGGREGGWDV